MVGEAGDGAEAIARVAELQPDVVLMDVRMPGVDGIEATEVTVARHLGVRVLVVTTYDLDEYAFASLRAGASGFLLKNARPEDPRPNRSTCRSRPSRRTRGMCS